jgi:hypothetical protein
LQAIARRALPHTGKMPTDRLARIRSAQAEWRAVIPVARNRGAPAWVGADSRLPSRRRRAFGTTRRQARRDLTLVRSRGAIGTGPAQDPHHSVSKVKF